MTQGSVKHRFPVASAVLGLESSCSSGLNLAHCALCEKQWCFRGHEESGTRAGGGLLISLTCFVIALSSLLV